MKRGRAFGDYNFRRGTGGGVGRVSISEGSRINLLRLEAQNLRNTKADSASRRDEARE